VVFGQENLDIAHFLFLWNKHIKVGSAVQGRNSTGREI
jgi:hypothetical protein